MAGHKALAKIKAVASLLPAFSLESAFSAFLLVVVPSYFWFNLAKIAGLGSVVSVSGELGSSVVADLGAYYLSLLRSAQVYSFVFIPFLVVAFLVHSLFGGSGRTIIDYVIAYDGSRARGLLVAWLSLLAVSSPIIIASSSPWLLLGYVLGVEARYAFLFSASYGLGLVMWVTLCYIFLALSRDAARYWLYVVAYLVALLFFTLGESSVLLRRLLSPFEGASYALVGGSPEALAYTIMAYTALFYLAYLFRR